MVLQLPSNTGWTHERCPRSLTHYKVFLLAVDLHGVDRVEGRLSRGLPLGLPPRKTPSQTAGSKRSAWGGKGFPTAPIPAAKQPFVTSRENQRHLGGVGDTPGAGAAPAGPGDRPREGARHPRRNEGGESRGVEVP